jgi:hypothetical protein
MEAKGHKNYRIGSYLLTSTKTKQQRKGVPSTSIDSLRVRGMEAKGHKNYRIGSYLLIGFASLLLLAALLPKGWDYVQGLLLILSTTCFIGGAFLFALGGDEVIEARLAGQLSVQGIATLRHIVRDQGGSGAAIFLPSDSDDGKVVQFIPTSSQGRPSVGCQDRVTYCNGASRTLVPPLAAPILEDLKRDNALVIPSEYALLMGAIREVCEDLLSVADNVDIQSEGEVVSLKLHNYLLFSGCASLREASPDLCVLCPCSICSLIACMIAEGLKCEVSLNQITLDESDHSLHIEVSYITTNGASISD